jgi:hypothetical protein
LASVTGSRLFGFAQREGKLLPVGSDALSRALLDTRPYWSVERLVEASYVAADETDDISLVGLAARLRDAVLLTALRESVVLYAEILFGCISPQPPQRPRYVWTVEEDFAKLVRRFVDTFNALFDNELPRPEAANAERFWLAYRGNKILGRCVRLGTDDSTLPVHHYHWAICRADDGPLIVQDFWRAEIMTTEKYRSLLGSDGKVARV